MALAEQANSPLRLINIARTHSQIRLAGFIIIGKLLAFLREPPGFIRRFIISIVYRLKLLHYRTILPENQNRIAVFKQMPTFDFGDFDQTQ